MWAPLVALAILATIGGFIGIGPAFRWATGTEHPGGKLNIVQWLNPVVWDPATREFKEHEAGGGHGEPAAPAVSHGETAAQKPGEAHGASAAGVYGNVHSTLAHSVESATHSELGTEWIFIIISLVAAGIGMGLGWLFYVKDPRLPATWSQRLRPLYNASYNKYWVDEFYGWAITRRTMDLARAVFTFDSKLVDGIVNGLAALGRGASRVVGGVDKYFVDGLVNTIAMFISRLMSPLFRAAQTGFTQNYALVMVLGLIVAVAIFFAGDIATALRGFLAFAN